MKEIIVYQMGKVASTSIVNSLNRVAQVRAFQSHFLGREALREILEGLLNPKTTEYFHTHNLGQLVANISVTRRIETHRLGLSQGDTLAFLSLAREPIDWLRSAITQDISGHVPSLLTPLSEDDRRGKSEDDCVQLGLIYTIGRIASTYELLKGVGSDEEFNNRFTEIESSIAFQSRHDFAQFKKMYLLFLRPLTWFEKHFRPALGFDVASMDVMGRQIYRKDSGWAKCYLIRYEDLPESMPWVLADLEIASAWAASADNVSGGKQRGILVRSAFESPEADRLRKLVLRDLRSPYVEQFGYVMSDTLERVETLT